MWTFFVGLEWTGRKRDGFGDVTLTEDLWRARAKRKNKNSDLFYVHKAIVPPSCARVPLTARPEDSFLFPSATGRGAYQDQGPYLRGLGEPFRYAWSSVAQRT